MTPHNDTKEDKKEFDMHFFEEGGRLCIKVNARCGLFYVPMINGQYLDFLADLNREDEGVYRFFKFVGVREVTHV